MLIEGWGNCWYCLQPPLPHHQEQEGGSEEGSAQGLGHVSQHSCSPWKKACYASSSSIISNSNLCKSSTSTTWITTTNKHESNWWSRGPKNVPFIYQLFFRQNSAQFWILSKILTIPNLDKHQPGSCINAASAAATATAVYSIFYISAAVSNSFITLRYSQILQYRNWKWLPIEGKRVKRYWNCRKIFGFPPNPTHDLGAGTQQPYSQSTSLDLSQLSQLDWSHLGLISLQ